VGAEVGGVPRRPRVHQIERSSSDAAGRCKAPPPPPLPSRVRFRLPGVRTHAPNLPKSRANRRPPPSPSSAAESQDVIDAPRHTHPARLPTATIPCYDPATMQSLGSVPAMSPDEVRAAIADCRAAQAVWKDSSFAQRRALMRVLLKYVVDNQETLCR